MKKTFILFFLLAASPLFAQITLEHTYRDVSKTFSIIQIDSGVSKILCDNQKGHFTLYNLDHSIYKDIIIPPDTPVSPDEFVVYITLRLFDLDDKLEFLVYDYENYKIRIINESGKVLNSFDSVIIPLKPTFYASNYEPSAIYNTVNGTKLLLNKISTTQPFWGEVYSLPGKLPTSGAKSSVTDPTSIISSGGMPTSAYPNPTDGKVRIEYKLPDGVTKGEIIITSTSGAEVKRYTVGNMFNDILIERTDLASGSYFYRLVTEKGESDAKRLVVTR